MPIIASAESDKPRELPDADIHHAVCYAAFDLGLVPESYQGGPSKVKHKALLFWELEQKMADGRPFGLSKEYTLNMFKKSTLFKHMTAWKGSALTAAEAMAFDLEQRVGKLCRLNVIHRVTGEGKTYANVDAVLPPDKKLEAWVPVNKDVPAWAHERKAKYAALLEQYYRETGEGDYQPPKNGAGLDEVPFGPLPG